MILPKVITLETMHLVLRTPHVEDTYTMMTILNDLETMEHLKYMTVNGNEWTYAKTRARIEDQLCLQENSTVAILHIYDRVTHQLIGVTGLPQLNLQESYGVSGIILHHLYWQKGYATEIMLAVLQYAFETLELEKIKFYTMSSNTRMRNFFAKFGIGFEGENDRNVENFHPSMKGGLIYSLALAAWPTVKESLLKALKIYQVNG